MLSATEGLTQLDTETLTGPTTIYSTSKVIYTSSHTYQRPVAEVEGCALIS